MATGEGGAGRQAGSSFKLFTLLAAINEGIDPETLIDAGYKVDLEGGEPVYNNDKADYGTRTIKSAFGVSSNTAFIRLLLSVGVDKVIEMAHAMGTPPICRQGGGPYPGHRFGHAARNG